MLLTNGDSEQFNGREGETATFLKSRNLFIEDAVCVKNDPFCDVLEEIKLETYILM